MKNNKINKKTPTTSVTLEELFETLNFYAEKENYSYAPDDYCGVTPVAILNDNGSKARKILKKFLKDGFFYAKI